MSFEKTVDDIKQSISILDKRIRTLEGIVLNKTDDQLEEEKFPELNIKKKINLESFSGDSQLGWLGIVISIIGCFFFVRYSFQQKWVTGLGQPIVLAVLGFILFVISDLIRKKNYPKFGATLAFLSLTFLFMAIYWSSIKNSVTSHQFLIYASLALWILCIFWGVFRKSSLWPGLGVAGASLLPIFIILDYIGTNWLTVYFLAIMLTSFALSLWRNWSSLGCVATLVTHIFILMYIRNVNLNPLIQSTSPILWMGTLFPAILIVWSGLVSIKNNRSTTLSEKMAWGINNLISYAYIFAFWDKFNEPWLVLIPLSVNALLYFASWLKKQSYEFLYLLGMVTSTAIALTILMPIPLDIITMCLFAVFLGHKGNKEDGWQLKSVSGAMIIWCLIFLFSMRFHFASAQDMPFFNLKFSSFVITFLCFGYQGRMINNDLNAKQIGPLLGQGLFSLGLAVLLFGMGGEVIHVFPAEDARQVSQLALLFLTILGGIFAFGVAYLGVVLKLIYIRILSILLYLILVSKLLFFDLVRLELLYLVISLGTVGLLLGSTSILLKKHKISTVKHA